MASNDIQVMPADDVASADWRPKVAGIMPLYNKRDTVLDAIESMLAQSSPPDEIVIVDDGSTDGSGDLVADKYVNHPLIRLIRQQNRGVSAARNAAIRASTAPILAFLDADDKWLPRRVEEQAAIMVANESCMIVLGAAVLCNESMGRTWIEGDVIRRETYLKEYFREQHLPVCSGVMVRRAALNEVGMFDESLQMGEDHDLWLRVMLRFGFAHHPKPVVWYRCCRPQTLASVERDFLGNDIYFAKHRYTFGRGISGRVIWGIAYAAVLRRHADWFFKHGEGWRALKKITRALRLWPFFNPLPLTKSAVACMLGPRAYQSVVSLTHRLRRRRPNRAS